MSSQKTDKSLKDKAINIKGKEYVEVHQRIIFFNDNYPNGSISTELVTSTDSPEIIIRAIVLPDIEIPNRQFTGYASEKVGSGFINKTSALENAETSAVGRALAMMGIGVIDALASTNELEKSQRYTEKTLPKEPQEDDGVNKSLVLDTIRNKTSKILKEEDSKKLKVLIKEVKDSLENELISQLDFDKIMPILESTLKKWEGVQDE